MADETFTIKDGDGIDIFVRSRTKSDALQTRKRKRRGLIMPFAPEENLSRRLGKTEALIRFYDLGYLLNIASGEHETVPFVFMTDIIEAGIFDADFHQLTAADTVNRDDYFFAVPFADWKTRFKKLTPPESENYHIIISSASSTEYLTADNPNWTSDGLKISEPFADAYSLHLPNYKSNEVVHAVTLSGEYKQKITTIRNPNAPVATGFNAAASFDLFLVPNIFFSRGNGSFETTPGNANERIDYLLNQIFTLFPREVLLDEANAAHDLYSLQDTYPNALDETLEHFNEFMSIMDFHKSLPGARLYSADVDGGGASVYNEATLADFPPAVVTFPQATGYAFPPFAQAAFTVAATPTGTLVAVISQGANWFYVWK